ncbi:unnamed protein product [Gadus morhua 'NCC']
MVLQATSERNGLKTGSRSGGRIPQRPGTEDWVQVRGHDPSETWDWRLGPGQGPGPLRDLGLKTGSRSGSRTPQRPGTEDWVQVRGQEPSETF